jgi:hypothetical protein
MNYKKKHEDVWFTVAQAAKFLGISRQLVQYRMHRGHFLRAKICECQNSYLIPLVDLHKEIHEDVARDKKQRIYRGEYDEPEVREMYD